MGKGGSALQYLTINRIAWCDNLVPNVYGTEVYLTCSLNDAQDVIIFQVKTTFSHPVFHYFVQTQCTLGTFSPSISQRIIASSIDGLQTRRRIHEHTISLRFPGIILRVLRLEVPV
jgi:hypothetical protein